MKKYGLTEKDIYKGNLILVNQDNLIKEEINLKSLEPFSDEYQNIFINSEANHSLQLLLKKIMADKQIVPVSGYRSLKEQQQIFDDSQKENGKDFTFQYVALPNASEHQTGLAIDLGLNTKNIDFIRPSFPYEGICEEFRENAYQYGFIERYPKEKESITNISAEEWHFRYVGYPHSEIIREKNFCLEEYIDFLKQGSLKFKNYEISYLPFSSKQEETELDDFSSISGNNVDGFIITRKLP